MNTLILKNRNLLTFGLPLLLILSIVVIAQSPLFQLHPEELSVAIIFDLILFIPAIYFLLIRKREIPKITTIPFFIAGIVIASLILPKDFQFYLTQVKIWVLPVVETAIFLMVIFKLHQLRKEFKKEALLSSDFYSALKIAAARILPKRLSGAFAAEIAVIYYGFYNWKRKKLKPNEFSYHRSSGTISLLSVFIFLIFIETSVVHILLQKWSTVAALILSILSIYTCLQIFGIMRSMSKRPISIEEDALMLRYGLFSESTIQISSIKDLELSARSIEADNTIKKLSPLRDFDSHNVIIHLENEEVLFGLYGMKSTYQTIALHVDDKEQFAKEIKKVSALI
jgi:hypothetical protein